MGDIKISPYFMGAWGLCWYIKQICPPTPTITPYQKLVCFLRVTVGYKGTKMLPFSQTHATKSGNHMVKSFIVSDTECPVWEACETELDMIFILFDF